MTIRIHSYGRPATWRFPDLDWSFCAERGVLTLGVILGQGRLVYGEFRDFGGAFRVTARGRSADLLVEADSRTLLAQGEAAGSGRARGGEAPLTWKCTRLRPFPGNSVRGAAIVRHGGVEISTCLRGRVFPHQSGSGHDAMMVSLVSRFDARPLGWPSGLGAMDRAHLRLQLVAELRPGQPE